MSPTSREKTMIETRPTLAALGGTGKDGTGVALRWAQAGFRVTIGSRSADRAAQATGELNQLLGLITVCGRDSLAAAQSAGIIVLTGTPEAQLVTLEGVRAALSGNVVVDATARADARHPKPPEGKASTRVA